jgi:hypothetical protein
MNKRVRGRWSPTVEQISLCIDCAAARVPLEKAAELVGVKPRTLRSFAKRIGPVPAGRRCMGEFVSPRRCRPGLRRYSRL